MSVKREFKKSETYQYFMDTFVFESYLPLRLLLMFIFFLTLSCTVYTLLHWTIIVFIKLYSIFVYIYGFPVEAYILQQVGPILILSDKNIFKTCLVYNLTRKRINYKLKSILKKHKPRRYNYYFSNRNPNSILHIVLSVSLLIQTHIVWVKIKLWLGLNVYLFEISFFYGKNVFDMLFLFQYIHTSIKPCICWESVL